MPALADMPEPEKTTTRLAPAQAAARRAAAMSAAATQAYLEALWLHRDVAVVFGSDDGPAGFARLRERRLCDALRRWTPEVAADPSPQGQLLLRMLSAILAEASSLVILCDSEADVALISDATIEAIDRLIR